MDLLGLDYAIRLPLRMEESLGCPRCHVRLAGSLRCDRCDFEMAWREGVLVCRPGESRDESRGAARAAEDGTWPRFLPAQARLVLDYTGGSFGASEWVAGHPGVEVVSLFVNRADVAAPERPPSPAVNMVSGWSEIPFSDRSVDAVLARDVDLQLTEWEASAFYREAWRVLRPGGWLVARNQPVGNLRSLGAFRSRLEREGHRYLGGEVECSFGAGSWLNLVPSGALEWAWGRRFTVVAARY